MKTIDDLKKMLSTSLNVETQSLQIIDTEEKLLDWLTQRIDFMVSHDFERLIQLLYRIDVSESKLKAMIAQNDAFESSRVVAKMILDRQKQKIYWRDKFKNDVYDNEEEESERW